MMMKSLTAVLVAAVTTAFSGLAHAELFSRGGNMVYDSYSNITWLADANYAFTSGYSTADGGRMSWGDANAWASNLTYGGYNDWRLPTTNTPSNTDVGALTVFSEMGHLAYYDQVSPANGPFRNVQGDTYWLGTSGPIPDTHYTFGMTLANAGGGAGGGGGEYGTQSFGSDSRGDINYAWAVRSGDVAAVAAVPEPETYAMMMAGLGMLGVIARRRKTS
jgi:hypothetical protein